jgi:ribonuclease HI
MSQNLCRWFSKNSKNTIKPNIPDLVQTMSEPVPVPVPVPVPEPRISNKRIIKVYTDGSTINNGKRAEIVSGGVGVYFGKNDARNISKKVVSKKVTNNVCELMACILAIEQVIKTEESMNLTQINIYSDSEYTINSIVKWSDKWEKNNYKKKDKGKWVDVKNAIYIKKLREYYKQYNVKFFYTPAHTSQPDPRKDKEKYDQWYGNYMADYLAKCASQN